MAKFRRRPERRLILRVVSPLALLGAIWLVGLFWFAGELPRQVGDQVRQTDAIVVLTGGSARLSQGLELLSQGKAQKLFVSGVYRGVDITDLFRVRQESPDEFACCVTLGHEADDTRGNAVETAAWLQDGIVVNGVDMIQWNDAGQIVDFKVMVRPLKAIQKVHGMMAGMLEKLQSRTS